MAIGVLDREMKDLASTKGRNFAYLIHRYRFRRDLLPDKLLKKRSELEVLCRLNQKVCKKAGLEELALSWRGLVTLSQEIIDAKFKLKEAEQ